MNLTKTPRFQNFHIEGINHISPTDAYFAITHGEAFLLDVREPNETKLESIN
jgi:rhodanese-related sulfurtransferase